MADKYLLENGGGVYSYQLEDASGDYLLENQTPASGATGGRWKVIVLPQRSGPPLFLHNDELGTVAQTTVVDDDGWWTGRLQGFAVPLVTPGPIFPPVTADEDVLPRFILVDDDGQLIVTQRPLVASIQALFDNDDIVPQTVAAIFDEDPWNVYGQQTSSVHVGSAITDDEVLPRSILVDDELWSIVALKPIARAIQAVLDTDEKVPQPAGSIVDEDVWQTWRYRQPDPKVIAQPLSGALAGSPPPPSPFGVDEDYWWHNAYKSYPYIVTAITDTDDPPVQVDEDFSIYLISGNFGIPGQQAFVFTDELNFTAAPTLGIDEEYRWTARQTQYLPSIQAKSDDETLPNFILVDEDYQWKNGFTGYTVPVHAVLDTDELPTPITPLNIDEDYWWHNGFAPYVLPVQALTDTDEIGTPVTPINVDEDYWWTNTQQSIWYKPAITDDEIGTQLIAPPEPPAPEPGPPTGGGPAWYYRYGKHRRGCDEEDEECYERAEEFLEELGEEEKSKLEKLVQKAVIAVKEDKPAQFKAAQRVFTTEVAKVSGIVKADIAAIWRVEVEHRIMEEEEEMTILLAYF